MDWRLLILLTAIPLTGCDTAPDYRFKMTPEVETPVGLERFSTVRQVVQTNALMIGSREAPAFSRDVEGEALALALPESADVYALLGPPGDFPEDVALLTDPTLHGLDRIRARIEQVGIYDLPRQVDRGDDRIRSGWPRLARFTRPNDPTSIVELDPDALPGGARLKPITIEITEEPVSNDIPRRLPWLADRRTNFSSVRYPTTDALAVTANRGMFTTASQEALARSRSGAP
ncbi:hypothetical protein BZG35_16485 [Brevundimonas sp. LM2]|uniref:hypothetical protein n=1 Tax=Brevundimonas sp. LM2 TaxID=1938605 RepID=UPI000983BC92|nr:hypothetical protein [Brevundimonas sp. LM2]AQR63075.1 hypothetical protein BZG35_16485 [Brevundimonas sp. LM2]